MPRLKYGEVERSRRGCEKGESEDARRLRRLGFSVSEDRHVIPEDRIRGSANLLSLPGSRGGQEGFQFMGEKRRGWRTRRVFPQLQMPKDFANHRRLLDERRRWREKRSASESDSADERPAPGGGRR